MRTTKLQTMLLIVRLFLNVLNIALKTIYAAIFAENPRKKIDCFVQIWAKKIMKIMRADYKVFGSDNVKFKPGEVYIIMSNHCSHFDIPIIYLAFPNATVRMFAKKELFKIPLWGLGMKKAEFLMIDRGNREQAAEALKQARDKLKSGLIVWVAPEGTRSRTGKLQEFKKGGFILSLQMKATIIPIGIRGSGNILPPGTWDFSVGEQIEVHIGKPIATTDYSIRSIRELMRCVEESIRKEAGQG